MIRPSSQSKKTGRGSLCSSFIFSVYGCGENEKERLKTSLNQVLKNQDFVNFRPASTGGLAGELHEL